MRAALQVEKYKNRHCGVSAPVDFFESGWKFARE
jgi:hypothetical protein